MPRKPIPILVLAAAAVLCAARAENLKVTAVRHWSLPEATRVAIEITGEFRYHGERLHNPERVFFDVFQTVPALNGRRIFVSEVGDRLLQRIRVAERQPGITRVVLDLAG